LILPSALLLIAFITWLLFRNVLFYQPAEDLTAYPVPFLNPGKLSALTMLLSVNLIFFPLLITFPVLRKAKNKYPALILLSLPVIIFIISVFIFIRLYKPDLARIIRLEKLVVEQDWDGIIRQQEKHPSANLIAQYYYNLALSEKGLLCERMFHGPQDFGTKTLCLPRSSEYYNRAVYFYYTTGLINEARHLAYESMVAYGYRPESLKILIKTELINGNHRVALKYINDLKRTLHYRKPAGKYEKMIGKPDLVKADPELGAKIRLLPQQDFFIRPDDRENINLLFQSNPFNLKAFEYRIAWMLLEKDYRSAVNEIRMMKLLGYKTIPRHLEEAVVGYTNITKIVPELYGLNLRPQAEKDFYEYGSTYNLYSGKKEILEKEMKKAGGNTYWYYLQFK